MKNPVFGRIDREVQQIGQPVGFRQPGQPVQGQPQQPQYSQAPYGQPQYGQPMPAGAAPQDLEHMYAQPSATDLQTGRLTMNDVYSKSGLLFGLMLAFAVGGWVITSAEPRIGALLWMGGIALTLVLGLVIGFSKKIMPPLIVLYAIVEGLFVGSISKFYDTMFAGVVQQAVLATLCVFAAMFALWKFQIVRITSKTMRILSMMVLGYALFALINFGAAMMGVGGGWGFGGSGWLGIAISVFAVGLAAFSLAADFETIFRAVHGGAPKQYSWLLAHGLLVTVVWLYLELLRLLARLRD